MNECFYKRNINSLHPYARLIYFARMKGKPFLCIITPIFDPALEPLKLLIDDLKKQTFKKFILVSISNGHSPEVKKFINELRETDKRFIYDEIPFRETPDWKALLINIAERRELAMKKYNATRYMFVDADSSVPDNEYIAKLSIADKYARKEIIITQTLFAAGTLAPEPTMLPLFPIELGRIDITNFTFSRKVALTHSYPQDIDPLFGPANDWRFFSRISNRDNSTIFAIVGVHKNVKKSYKSIAERYYEESAR